MTPELRNNVEGNQHVWRIKFVGASLLANLGIREEAPAPHHNAAMFRN